jgi:hypothetical protein
VNHPLFRFAVVGLIALAALCTRVAGQTPEIVMLFKAVGYNQTNATTRQPFEPSLFAMVFFPTAVDAGTTVQLRGPTQVLIPRAGTAEYYLERTFSSEAALDQTVPDGSYTVNVSGSGVPSSTSVTIPSSSSVRPVLFTNFDALQAWSESSLHVTWQPIEGAGSYDLMQFTVEREDGTEIYSSPDFGEPGALSPNATSITVNGLTAAVGEKLYCNLMYVRLFIDFANGQQTVVAGGRGFYLRMPIVRGQAAKPVIVAQPTPQTILAGTPLALSVGATGSGLTYQWRRNGVPLAGGTSSTYVVMNPQTATNGFYTVDVSNSGGSITSDSVAVTVIASTNVPGRISNLSIRSQAGAGNETLIVGLNASGPKPLLIRAVGPTLVPFGVTNALPNPRLEVYSDSARIAFNEDWGGNAQVGSVAAELGAFALSGPDSLDAALYTPSFSAGAYTIMITGATGTRGIALAEVYDATTASGVSATMPRLTNVSARAYVGLGNDVLIGGFVVSGETSKTVLIRAVGPTLGNYNVAGALMNPQLELISNKVVLQSNDDWGGDSSLSTIFLRVGAFALSTASRDAAMVVTLPPGNYTAQVSGVAGGTGIGLVEVYEVQ